MDRAAAKLAAMRRALELARRGVGLVEPNPAVGCVLLSAEGEVVGEGYHERFGGPHAEVVALRDGGIPDASSPSAPQRRLPAGGTAVVTLEPCCHMGKTPPCVEALIEAGVRRVVVAMRDPDPRVDGSGIARLRAAGVEVEVGLLEAEARRLNAGFIKRVTLGLPWVIGKWAQTLDGKTATASGDSRWISGEASRELVHRLRGRVDAVMVGAGTARADDPSLTARPADVGDVKRRAVRVVVGDPAGVPIDLRMLGDGGPEVWVRGGEGGDLRPVLRELVEQRGATHVLCEGGAGLLGSLSEQGLVDEWWVFVAPKLLGDGAARSAVAGRSVERIADAQGLVLESVERVGEDVWLRYLTGAGVAVCEPASETPGPGWQAPAR